MRVFVLLFNAGTENEGIHTLKVGDRNTILMFESEDDATRYGLMLEAQDFITPSVEAFESEEIEEFCQGSDYDCKLVPEGTLAVPPETNLEQTDWQPDGTPANASSAEKPDFSQSELDEIRRRLEGLI
ncbi:DUF3110 domain-containing protein [Thermocoleostomius sinensis]|jgi:hypothetical protein|uniref:DUF3110 domain-containing protein n=1 Tax=Thermocoleostomius sinensis A174 TaxID=2016057 RepID=A0A9E9CAJ4_9CYAN|nr:DUF3110 domain-containing protein [Thermocoleostomius sinensis]WAL59015.1 DUF3110 domain-containing protein [Thermocoleostomius sinensis A174]